MLAALFIIAVSAGCGNTTEEDVLQSSGEDSGSMPQETGTEESGTAGDDTGADEAETADSTDAAEKHYYYTEYEYDANSRLTKWTKYHLMGDGCYYVDSSMEYEYDENGNVCHSLFSNGGSTEWEYDDAGNLVRVEAFSSADNNRWGMVAWEGFGQGTNWIESWECDQKGNLEPVYRRFGGGLYEYKYDENGRLMWEASYTRSETTEKSKDTLYDVKSLWYDQNGRIAVVERPAQLGISEYYVVSRYNGSEYVDIHDYDVERFNADYFNSKSWPWVNNVTIYRDYYEYDEAGRLKREVSKGSDSTTTARSYEYEYDENGNKVRQLEYSHTDPASMGIYVYREGDSLIVEGGQKDLLYEYEWTYDEAGNAVKEMRLNHITGESTLWKEWEYDTQGNVTKFADVTRKTLYQYYEDGKLKSETHYNNITGGFEGCEVYDKGGLKIYGVSQEEEMDTLEYDDAGMLISAITGVHCYEFEYDKDGRITKILE